MSIVHPLSLSLSLSFALPSVILPLSLPHTQTHTRRIKTKTTARSDGPKVSPTIVKHLSGLRQRFYGRPVLPVFDHRFLKAGPLLGQFL